MAVNLARGVFNFASEKAGAVRKTRISISSFLAGREARTRRYGRRAVSDRGIDPRKSPTLYLHNITVIPSLAIAKRRAAALTFVITSRATWHNGKSKYSTPRPRRDVGFHSERSRSWNRAPSLIKIRFCGSLSPYKLNCSLKQPTRIRSVSLFKQDDRVTFRSIIKKLDSEA